MKGDTLIALETFNTSTPMMGFTTPSGHGAFPVAPEVQQEIDALTQRKCMMCGVFFTRATAHFEKCRFHPGVFKDPESTDLREGATTGWSCCSVEEVVKMPPAMAAMAFMPGVKELVFLSKKSQKKSCPGCKEAEMHTEDQHYNEIMSNFPVDLVRLREEHAKRCEAFALSKLQNSVNEEEEDHVSNNANNNDDAHYFQHRVRRIDTLEGIALYYNVSVADIKRCNSQRMIGDMFKHLDFIRIPKVAGFDAKAALSGQAREITDAEKQRIVMRDFINITKATQEEAKYYCSTTNWVLRDAVNMFKEDSEMTK